MIFKAQNCIVQIISILSILVLLLKTAYMVPVNLTVYYETLCPDSVRFIKTQLFPTWTLLGGSGNPFLDVTYIPYGYATTNFENGVYSFQCQHGADECEGNKMHACALSTLPVESHGAFIDCTMSYVYSPSAGPTCSQKLNLNYTLIDECMNSSEGLKLLASYGNLTQSLSPALYYVPWITYDGNFSSADLRNSESDLMDTVCRKLNNVSLPSVCTHI